jgi:dihydroorotate dehydrogenase (fumarate)
VRFLGTEFERIVGIASGVLPPVKAVNERVCKEYTPAFLTSKTLTPYPMEPHKEPTVIKFHEGCYMNAIGLGNPGIEGIKESLVEGCRVIISAGGAKPEEFAEVARHSEGAFAVELNVSSPNRKGFGESTKDYLKDVIQAVKSATALPVIVKLGPWDNVVELAGKALEYGADALTLINTLKGKLYEIEGFTPLLSYGTGGISGRCILPLAVRIISEVYAEYGAQIIGVGGVLEWHDALMLLASGARLVGLASAIMERGFKAVREIEEGLREYFANKGLKPEDVVGIGVKR